MSRAPIASLLQRFEHPIVLVVYTLVALGMSYPLVAQFGDHIPGVDGDVWSYLWALGWARTALEVGTNPFHTDYIFYPLGGATQLLWGTALPSFASIPLQMAFGLVPAFNLVYLAASVLTAYGMYLLGKDVLRDGRRTTGDGRTESNIRLASFVAGLVFAFGTLRMGYGIAFTNLFHTEFIPFYVLFLIRATRRAGWKDAILAGLFFALNVYVDFQIAAFLAVFTALWFLFVIAKALLRGMKRYSQVRHGLHSRDDGTSPYLRWAVVIVTAGILALPMLGFVLEDFAVEGGNYIRVYPLRYSEQRAYDLLAYVLPNARSTVYQSLPYPKLERVNAAVEAEGDSDLSPDRQSFLGLTVLVLAVIGAVRFRRQLVFWIVLSLFFAVLSLGPVLHVAGVSTGIPMPFALANNVPILNHIRIPMRYGLMVFFGAAVLAGAGTLVLLNWRRWLVVPIAGLILLEAAILPYPTLEYRVPPLYEEIARETGDFTVLEIPSFHWRFAAKNSTFQMTHEKRILRTYTNRVAPDVADYFNLRQTPIVVRSLRILEGAEQGVLTDEEIAEDKAALNATLNLFNVRYAVLHRDQLGAERSEQVDAYLRDVLGARLFYEDEQVTGYRLDEVPSVPPLAIDVADNASLMYLGRGWQIEPLAEENGERGRYVRGEATEVYFPSGENASGLVLHTGTGSVPSPADAEINGEIPTQVTATDGTTAFIIALQNLTLERLNRLDWRHSAAEHEESGVSIELVP